jgi:hypothetical protein
MLDCDWSSDVCSSDLTESGEVWRAAHVASGVDAMSAKQRSDRTIAFYRGEAPPDIAHPGTGS